MRFSFIFAAAVAISIPVFSRPVPRAAMRVMKRALFSEAVKLSDLGSAQALAAAVGNIIGGPPEVCALVSDLFAQLEAGETAGGSTTVGDRAVVGIRKMLGKQSLTGEAGISAIVSDLITGSIPAQSVTALQDLVSNSDKTIASLKAYKYLIDTQNLLQELVETTKRVDGDPAIESTVLGTALPIMKSIETTIDKIGGDFSVQSFNPTDVPQLQALVDTSAKQITGLRALNRSLASAITAVLVDVEVAFANLKSSIDVAAAIPESARKIEPEAFKIKDYDCQPGGLAVAKSDHYY